jgi:PAS domain S-box-containing protein
MVVRSPDLKDLIEATLSAIKGDLPLATPAAPEEVSREHAGRLQRQIERQARLNASLAERCALQTAQLTVLSAIGDVLARAPDVESALEEILARCLDASGLSLGLLYLVDANGRIRVGAAVGYERTPAELETFFGQPELLDIVLHTNSLLLLPSAEVPPRVARAVLAPARASAGLLVRIGPPAEPLGVLVMMSTTNRHLVQEDWVPFAHTTAAQLGQALRLGRLFANVTASEQLYRGLFEAVRDGIVLTDTADRIVDANPAMCQLAGRSLEALRALRLSEVVPAVPASARTTPTDTAGDRELLTGDGSRRQVVLSGGSLDGKLHFTVVQDVTERRRLQAHVAQTEKLAAMGELLAGVAHELNNPLAVVVGNAMLLQEMAPAGPLAERAQRVAGAGNRCARIVKNFLALARQHPPERQPISLNQVVRDAVEFLGYALRVADVEAELRLETHLPALWGDPHQLHQVVVNLISNAQQALRGSPAPRRVSVTTRLAAGRVFLEVADTGPGIPQEIADRIFEPFFTTKPVGQGTGLGLSLCRGIVEDHGGTIQALTGTGSGALFRIELPMSEPRGASGPVVAVEPPTVRNAQILVADDEIEVAQVLAELLALEGHTVDVVANGVEALDRMALTDYDLVLSDMRMPELDGPALYGEVARRRPGMERRFVFLTGDTLGPDTAAFLERAGVPSLGKPFVLAEVRRVVRSALAR